MDRYKQKKLFLKLALFLTLGVTSLPSWAYNQTCHSPVQLAALLSPNKPKLSKGENIRNKIKTYEKKREAIEVRMDEQEDNLGDSLDEKKLGQDPYSVASEIRNYIENKQNGWPCVQDDTTTSIHYTGDKAFLKYFPIEHLTRHFLLKMNVLDLLIPSAYAAGNVSGEEPASGITGSFNSQDIPSCPGIQVRKDGKSDGKCECPEDKPIPDSSLDDYCREDCPAGTSWDSSASKCGNPCKGGQVWTTIKGSDAKCSCPSDKPIFENNTCRISCKKGTSWDSSASKCVNSCQGGQVWTTTKGGDAKCACPSDKPIFENNTCRISCKKGTSWDSSTSKCVNSCQGGQVWTTTKGGDAKCSCPSDKPIFENNTCRISCKKGTSWDSSTSKCVNSCQGGQVWTTIKGGDAKCTCPSDKPIFENNTCRISCKKGTSWDSSTSKCVNSCKGGKVWKVSTGKCECPDNKPILDDKDGEICREKTREEKCKDKEGNWDKIKKKCFCPSGQIFDEYQNKCREETDKEKCEEQKNKSWVNGECIDCPKWKKHPAFEDDGEVDSSFCDAYASDTRACKNALSRLSRLTITLEKYQDAIDKLEDQLLGLNDSEDTKTQAGGLCFECLKRELKANRQTPGQMIGNFSKILTGVGLSMVGYSAGQKAQTKANILRIQQGYAAEDDMYSLQGAGFGFPFIANGLYGMTRTNTPVGGWSCTPSVNPHGQAHTQYAHGQGYMRPYYL